MRNASGTKATTSAESAANWREHGEALGKYDPSDTKSDVGFATISNASSVLYSTQKGAKLKLNPQT
jgi:hypothetical protein